MGARSEAVLVLLVCLYSDAVFASSSSSSSTYTTPQCQSVDGFYCRVGDDRCPPRTKRCTGDDSAPLCEQKNYEHCDYVSTSGKFKVYRFSTNLQSFGSSRRLDLACLKPEHQFITYRGLMYEFGSYGTRVQDPSDPKYEYNTRTSRDRTRLGESSCTYEEVVEFLETWDNYNFCSHNCQHFAKGLGEYLTTDCKHPNKRSLRSDDDRDLADYIFRLAGDGNCTGTLQLLGSASPSAVPLQYVMFSSVIAIAIICGAVI